MTLCHNFFIEMKEISHFDQAMAYHLNENGKVIDHRLVNIDEQTSIIYLNYYEATLGGLYSVANVQKVRNVQPKIHLKDWNKEPKSTFIKEYIQPRGLAYSLGYAFFDTFGTPRTIVSLDKTKGNHYSDREVEMMTNLLPILDNLHQKFFLRTVDEVSVHSVYNDTPLTKREKEVLQLLLQGVTPKNISQILYIAQPTTNTHIRNIYKKTHVSSIRELIAKFSS